ncbi:MAG: AraC family transcriptional regulator [Phyllobacterium sp.]
MGDRGKQAGADLNTELNTLHNVRLSWLEREGDPVVALPGDYPDGHHVPPHNHSRGQLLYALSGVVMVTTSEGRWMVPTEHALWIPAGMTHSVEMVGAVRMRSVYVLPGAIESLPDSSRVVGMTNLMRSLIVEATDMPPGKKPHGRDALVMSLILHEIPRLPELPLGLPFPTDPQLAALCRRFVIAPSSQARIDDWAEILAMSRRAFTRAFRRETGLSLSTWRQQACLFAALPRLAAGEAVTSVALDLGYESTAAFTTMFKRMTGVPPQRYLRDIHNQWPQSAATIRS